MTLLQWAETLPADAQGRIVLETLPSGGTIHITHITPSQLVTVLGNIASPPTHAALSTLPIAVAGGWQKYFDAWKAQGIIS